MKRGSFRICLLFALVLLSSTAAHARIYENIVAFGDSLSDHHGLEFYIGLQDPVVNPNGAPAVWSNGDVWVEYLADNWGASLDNNAIGGAMTLGHENVAIQALSDDGTFPQLGLVGQTTLYLSSSPEFDPEETLFTIWIGGNDLLEFGKGESYTIDPEVMITDAMNNITNAVVALYSQGATHFLMLNLPDFGKLPAYNTKSAEDIAAATGLAQAFNSALDTTIEVLKTNLEDISIDSFDAFSYLSELIETNAFANVTDTYMEVDDEGNRTGNVNGDADDYLFWDNVHPMTRAHEMFADELSEGLYPEDNDGGDSSCFINSIHGNKTSSANQMIVLLLASMLVGITSIFFKKRV
ncbi:MAG: SGNH/GDSL hydrolase family protein [Desulfobacterium sp.]